MAGFEQYFRDEVAYLRELGEEFSQVYPALMPNLWRGGDPDIERLLEGVAFLTARLRQKLDDDLPEVAAGMAELLFPQLLRSTPASAVVEFRPMPQALTEQKVIPQGTEVGALVDGVLCRFSTCAAMHCVPWVVEEVEWLKEPGRHGLRLHLRATTSTGFQHTAPSGLRLQLGTTSRSGLGVVSWLLRELEEVTVVGSTPEVAFSLGPEKVRHFGFRDDESLFPEQAQCFPGFRLLQEYFALPEKFSAVELAGLERLRKVDSQGDHAILTFWGKTEFADSRLMRRDFVRLNCVPVVNVFQSHADPIRLDRPRERFLVRPSGYPVEAAEVYCIRGVTKAGRGASEPVATFAQQLRGDGKATTYYTESREPSVLGSGVDWCVSLGTSDERVAEAWQNRDDVLSLELLCTNRSRPSGLGIGDICRVTDSSPAFAQFSNVTRVSAYVPPRVGRGLQWRVAAQLANNLHGICDVGVMRSVLRVHNPFVGVDRQTEEAVERKAIALRELRLQPSEIVSRGALIRGARIELVVDETAFVDEGDLFLFASVLNEMFGQYVSLNSFAQVNVTTQGSRLRFEFAPQDGEERLL